MKTTIPFKIESDKDALFRGKQPIFQQIPYENDVLIACEEAGTNRCLLSFEWLKLTIGFENERGESKVFYLFHEKSHEDWISNYYIESGSFEKIIETVKSLILKDIEETENHLNYLKRLIS